LLRLNYISFKTNKNHLFYIFSTLYFLGFPYITSIETGLQSSGEGADQGFEQIFLVTFKSEGKV
jgi:hypothetical protein